MKRYKVAYFYGDRSNIGSIIGLSKSEKRDGARIWFFDNGKKHWQINLKNDFWNGLAKNWRHDNKKNNVFLNCKKGKEQGIKFTWT